MLSPRRELLLLFTLAGIQFTHIVDFMIMMPLGPQFTALFNIGVDQFGLLVSAYTFAAGFSGLLAAFYIDRFDRKRLALVLYGLFALATLSCGLAQTYEQLLIARLAAGAFGGVLTALVNTIVAEIIPYERRGRAMGIVMSAFSLSTVAGVPTGLYLANRFNWHIPFISLAVLSFILAVFAALTLPRLPPNPQTVKNKDAKTPPHSAWSGIVQVVADPGHRVAMLFSTLMIFVGFTTIPYITLYAQKNVGIQSTDIPLIYLVGGIATLISARIIGVLTDKRGKQAVFSTLAMLAIIPIGLITILPTVPLLVMITVTTLFFVLVSGRMIPGMALITASARPELRGTFMTLNASLQSLGMAVASWLGGRIIHIDANGMIQNYWGTAIVGAFASMATLVLVRKLVLRDTPASAFVVQTPVPTNVSRTVPSATPSATL